MGWSLDNLVHCSPPVILQINPASFPISLSDSSYRLCYGLQQPVQNTKALVFFVPAIQSSNDAPDRMRQTSLPIPIMDRLLCICVCGKTIWFSSVSVTESEFSAWKKVNPSHCTNFMVSLSKLCDITQAAFIFMLHENTNRNCVGRGCDTGDIKKIKSKNVQVKLSLT